MTSFMYSFKMAEALGLEFKLFLIICFSLTLRANAFPNDSIAHLIYKTLNFDRSKYRLYLAGNFMAAHKYYGVDYRKFAQDAKITDDDRVFYREFPIPPLQEMQSDLASQCKQSLQKCINLVYEKAKDSFTMSKFFIPKDKVDCEDKKDVRPFWAPFESAKDMFVFRQTASYYLCSYAVHWKKLGKEIVHLQHSGEPGCIEHLVYVSDVPKDEREIVLQNLGQPYAVNDFRSRGKYNSAHSGAMCAMLWFCPDPCLGRKNRGAVFNVLTYSDDKGNRCRDLHDPRCDWDWKANGNFEDFIRNKFNVSCNCYYNYKGFRWSNEFDLCIDVDECKEKTAWCRGNKICLNTPGSYKCVCPRGFKENPASRRCEVTSGLMALGLSIGSRLVLSDLILTLGLLNIYPLFTIL